jgi:hypothetical protein
MSKIDPFWRYAKEGILSAYEAKTDEDREGLLEFARTWTQAALRERPSANHHDRLPEASAAYLTNQSQPFFPGTQAGHLPTSAKLPQRAPPAIRTFGIETALGNAG